MKYKVTITRTLVNDVEVNAPDEETAAERALEADDLSGAETLDYSTHVVPAKD